MALTTFLPLYSGLDTPKGGVTATDTRRIPVAAPYEVFLSRIPRCSALSASVIDNAFTTITALRGEVAVTINSVPAVIIDGASPTASGEVALQIREGDQWRFSPKAVFHSSDAGKAAAFTYTGFMSNADSRYLIQMRDAISRLETLPPCGLLSLKTYDGGAFLNGTADGTGVYVTSSRGALPTTAGMQVWPGGVCSLSLAGATQVSAFTDVDGYKTISLYLLDDAGTLSLVIAESAESATRPTTPTVTPYSGGWLCGTIIVQGDGTGAAGGILPIVEADCASLWNSAGAGNAAGTRFALSFATYGAVLAGEVVDVPMVVPCACLLESVSLYVQNAGTTGTTQADVWCKPDGEAWASLFAAESFMPAIAASDDDGTATVTTFTGTTLNAGDRIKATWHAAAAGAAIGRVTVWLRDVS